MELTNTSKVLVVDDQDIVVRQNQMILRSVYGIDMDDVLTAGDGEEALEIVRENPDIDLIISDMDMPGMDGLPFFIEMRQDETLPIIPFVMSTGGNAERQQEIEGIFAANGGNALFTEKPFGKDKMANSVAKLLPRSERGGTPYPSA